MCAFLTLSFAGYLGYGWYRYNVKIDKQFDSHKRLYILFNGVDEEAEVYINGQKAFTHTCESTGLKMEQIWIDPFVFDAREYIKFGEENLIAVRVLNRYGMGGIHKPVFVVSTDTEPNAENLRLIVGIEKSKTGKAPVRNE